MCARLASHAGVACYNEFNDVGQVEDAFGSRGSEIAAVILEPVVGNMGVVGPEPDFLEAVQQIARRFGQNRTDSRPTRTQGKRGPAQKEIVKLRTRSHP